MNATSDGPVPEERQVKSAGPTDPPAKVSHALLWQGKATFFMVFSPRSNEDALMTAISDVSTSTLAASNVTSQVFGSGLIGLREGLEAAIVVSILVAFLVKSERRDALKWVWLGVGAAIAMTVTVFLVIQFGENTISGLGAEA